jgi:hypothetical protein
MAVDVQRFKELLVEERRGVVDAIEYLPKENPGSIEEETEDELQDNHIEDRLAAIPWATYCIHCKRLQERF